MISNDAETPARAEAIASADKDEILPLVCQQARMNWFVLTGLWMRYQLT